MAAKKKAAKAPKKARKRPDFTKGNTFGKATRFGQPGGNKPGRPPGLKSPRKWLAYWCEQQAPEKLRQEVAKVFPEMDVESLSVESAAMFVYITRAMGGDMTALEGIIRHIADDGATKTEITHSAGEVKGLLEKYGNVIGELAGGSAKGTSPGNGS